MTYRDVIKSAKLQKHPNGNIQVSYYLLEYLREGGSGRVRFNIAQPYNKRNVRYYGDRVKELSYEHYLANKEADAQSTFRDVATAALEASKNDRGADTHQIYISHLERRILPVIGDKLIGSIKVSDLNKLKNSVIEAGISKSTFHKFHSTLRLVFNYAYENEIIDTNPIDRVRRDSKLFANQQHRASGYYTPDEIKLILENATGMLKVLLSVLFMTGMRTNEATALSWKDIDFEHNVITVAHSLKRGKLKSTKTNKVRQVDMNQTLKALLQEYKSVCRSSEFLFTNQTTGKLYYDANMINQKQFKPLLKRLGIEYKSLYSTRHSFASNLIAQNAPLPFVQKTLGHAKLSQTLDSYTRNEHINNAQTTELMNNLYA